MKLLSDTKLTLVIGVCASIVFLSLHSALFAATLANRATAVLKPGKPVIISVSHPDQNAWYSSKKITVAWDVPADVTEVRTLYDGFSTSIPNKVYIPPISGKDFSTDFEGVQYMHVQFKNKDGWGDVAHFKFQIDSTPPVKIHAFLGNANNASSPHPEVYVTAEDALSGLRSVEISVDGHATTSYAISASNAYNLPRSLPGNHTAFIQVKDKAGNKIATSLQYVVLAIEAPTVDKYSKYIQKGSPFTMKGTTYPSSVVQIVFVNVKTEEMILDSAVSKEDGTFEYTNATLIPVGVYEMRARVVDKNGAESKYTEMHVVEVDDNSLLKIGMFIVNWLSLILILVLAGMLVIATFWYSLLQFARFRRRIRRTMQEAEHALKTNVQALRRDAEEFHALLIKAEKKRELTKEERSILKKFKKRIDFTETEIEEKLKQIT